MKNIFLVMFLLVSTAGRAGIIPPDQRVPLLTNGFPYSAVGKIFNGDEECTGTLVWRNLVLTNAHCVLSSGANLVFAPNLVNDEIRARQGLPVRGLASPLVKAEVVAHGDYSETKRSNDWALLRLAETVGDKYNWIDPEVLSGSGNLPVNLPGYSIDNYYARGVASVDKNCRLAFDSTVAVWEHYCDTYEGASGSPMLRLVPHAVDGNRVTMVALHAYHIIDNTGPISMFPRTLARAMRPFGTEPRNFAIPVKNFYQEVVTAIATEAQRIGISQRSGAKYSEPEQMLTGRDVPKLAIGNYIACFLMDGKVECVPSPRTQSCQDDACKPPVFKYPRELAYGNYYGCVIDAEGVKCWGNMNGEPMPKLVSGFSNPRGLVASADHACFIHDGGVYCFGRNVNSDFDPMLNMPKLNQPTQLIPGYHFTCALDKDGVQCWGTNESIIKHVPDFKYFQQISGGENQMCALNKGQIICWGTLASEMTPDYLERMTDYRSLSYSLAGICGFRGEELVCMGKTRLPTRPNLIRPIAAATNYEFGIAVDEEGVKVFTESTVTVVRKF